MNKRSFTLIELIVSVGVIALVLPPVFNIFFSMIRQQLVLVSYQQMKQQGDSARSNVKNILQNRTAYITDTDSNFDICPVIPLPTPTYSPEIYIKDREGITIHLYPTPVDTIETIASESGKIYYLTTKDVTISDLGFSCHHINDFSPAIVSTQFTVQKSTVFKDISLPYSFNTRLRNY